VTAASIAVAVFVCLYHLGLMSVALFFRKRTTRAVGVPSHSFAIVIPAYNEETILADTLASCAELDYPSDKRTVYVIADNCSDQTAEVSKNHGVACLIRHDERNRGKGFALEWALPQVLAAGHDAIVILDADCQIGPRSLRVFDGRLKAGDSVLQGSDVVANPDAGATSYLLAIANTLENECFYSPKSVLGLAVMLRGTGMAFHRDVLVRFPWHAKSIVEDAEYSCQLLQGGYRIRFVPEARVLSDFPISREQLVVQRTRWIGGGLRAAAACGPRLAWEAVRRGSLMLLDAALTLFISSRPLVIAQLLLSLLLAVLCWCVSPTAWSAALLGSSLAVIAGYILYVAVGVLLLGVSRKRIGFLIRAPLGVAGYVGVALKAMLLHGVGGWQRTPRADEPASASPK